MHSCQLVHRVDHSNVAAHRREPFEESEMTVGRVTGAGSFMPAARTSFGPCTLRPLDVTPRLL